MRDAAGDLWRRILPRMAADRLGLELVLAHFEEGELHLPEGAAADEDALFLSLDEDGETSGLVIVDAALRAGLIEVQTTGRIIATGHQEPRPPTAVDAALVRHAIGPWLTAVMAERGEGTQLAPGRAFRDLRAALLAVEDGVYRETRIELSLGGGKRSGGLRILQPIPGEASGRGQGGWDLRAILHPVEAPLEAVLCRIEVPLATVASMMPGDVLPLPGVSVRNIRLEAPLGHVVASAHLGQSRGNRAVRIIIPDATDADPLDEKPAPSFAADAVPLAPPPDLPDGAEPLPAPLPSLPG